MIRIAFERGPPGFWFVSERSYLVEGSKCMSWKQGPVIAHTRHSILAQVHSRIQPQPQPSPQRTYAHIHIPSPSPSTAPSPSSFLIASSREGRGNIRGGWNFSSHDWSRSLLGDHRLATYLLRVGGRKGGEMCGAFFVGLVGGLGRGGWSSLQVP